MNKYICLIILAFFGMSTFVSLEAAAVPPAGDTPKAGAKKTGKAARKKRNKANRKAKKAAAAAVKAGAAAPAAAAATH